MQRVLHAILAVMLAVIAITTPTTSNVPGGCVWALLGMISAGGFTLYILRPSGMAAAWAVAAFLTQSIPRTLIWISEWALAAAAIWVGWTVTVLMWWADRPREAEQ